MGSAIMVDPFLIITIITAVIGGVQAYQANKQAKELRRKANNLLVTKFGTGEAIPVLYGRRRIAGTVLFAETVNQKDLFVVYALSVGEVEEIHGDTILIDGDRLDKASRFKGDNFIIRNDRSENYGSGTALFGATTADKNNVLDIYTTTNVKVNNKRKKDNAKNFSMVFNLHHGSATQSADPMLTSVFDGTGNKSTWSSDHKLSGIAYIAAHFQHKQDGRFRGLPELTVEVEGRKVYDPRLDSTVTNGSGSHRQTDTSTHAGTSNPAINFLDYLTNTEYGKGIPFSKIDLSSFQTAANVCDNTIATISDTSFSISSGQTGNKQDKLIIPIASIDNFSSFKVGNSISITNDSNSASIASGIITGKSYFAGTDGIIDHYELNMASGSVASTFTSAVTASASQTQKRFEFNGVVDTSESIMTNSQEFLASMRGIFAYQDSKYYLNIEHTVSSAALNIDEDDILEEGFQLSLESKERKFNKVEVSFYNAQRNYEKDSVVYTGETSDTFLSDDGNEVLEEKAEFSMVTNQQIAYNHAKSILFRSRRQRQIKFTGTPKLLNATVGDVIGVTHSKFDLTSSGGTPDQFRITRMTLRTDLNIEVEAIEYQADIYGYATPPTEDIDYANQVVDRTAVVQPSNLTFVDKDPTTGIQAFLSWEDANVYPSRFRVTVRNEQFVQRTVATSDGSATTVDTTYKIIGDSISNQTMSFLEAGYIASSNYSFSDGTFTFNQAGISGEDLSALKFPFDELFATTGDGSTTAFTFNTQLTGLTTANILPFIDGVYQAPESFAFNTSSKVLTFDAAPPNSSIVEVFMDDEIEVISETSTGQTAFTLDPIFPVENLLVFIGGGYQKADAFSIATSTTGMTVTFDESISSGTKVHFVLMPEKVEGVIYTTITDETSIDLSNIRINDGYKGEVSAINAFGFESAPATVTFTNTQNPVQPKYDVPDNIIQGQKLVDAAVTSVKLANTAVTNAKIAVDAIQGDVIAAGAITETKIGADAVTNAKLANDAVTADIVAASAITATKITDGAIETAKLAANAVTAAKVAAGTITSNEIAANTIQAGDIAAGTITGTEIAGNTITGAKIVGNTITASEIASGTITATEIATGTITSSLIQAGTIVGNDIAAGTIAASNLAVDSVTANKISAGSIDIAGKSISGTAGNITGSAGINVTNLSNDTDTENTLSTWFASNPPHFYISKYMTLITSVTWTTPAYSGTKEYIVTAQGQPLGSFGGDEDTAVVLLVRKTSSATGYLSSNSANFDVQTGVFNEGSLAGNAIALSDKFDADGNSQYFAYMLMTINQYGSGNKGISDASILVYGLGV